MLRVAVDQDKGSTVCTRVFAEVAGLPILILLSVGATLPLTDCSLALKSFSAVILWKMVGFWVPTVGQPDENRGGLVNRVRDKRSLSHSLLFPWVITLKV